MGSIVVLGEEALVTAFGLGGATVAPAEDAESARRAWDSLPDDVALVVLTARAASSLRSERSRDGVLRVVMPS